MADFPERSVERPEQARNVIFIDFLRKFCIPKSKSGPARDILSVSNIAVPGGFRRHHNVVHSARNGKVAQGRHTMFSGLVLQMLDPGRTLPDCMNEEEDMKSCKTVSFAPGDGSPNSVTVLVLIKTFLTGTILVLPGGYKLAGLVPGCCALCFVGALEVYCMQLLVACRAHQGYGSYSELAASLGSFGPAILRAMLVASQFGFVCAEHVYVASNALKVMSTFYPDLDLAALIFMSMVILVPLSWVRKIGFFAVTNLIGDVLVISCVAYLFFYGALHLDTNGKRDVELANSPRSSMLFMGTCVYVYEGINVVLPIYEAHECKDNFSKLLGTVLTILTVVFVLFGSVWYLAFGSETENIASLNLPQGSLEANIIATAYAIACLFTTPILFFPLTQELEAVIFPIEAWTNVYQRKWAKNLFRSFLMLFSGVVGAVGGQNLESFLGIIGGLCCGPLAIMFPAAMHLKICEPTGMVRIVDLFLVVIGGAVTGLSTAIAVSNL